MLLDDAVEFVAEVGPLAPAKPTLRAMPHVGGVIRAEHAQANAGTPGCRMPLACWPWKTARLVSKAANSPASEIIHGCWQYIQSVVGQQGSIAIVERFIRSMKDEFTHRLLLPLRLDAMRTTLADHADWFNQFRPHTALHGATPDERYFGKLQANRWPRLEPRARWPRISRCAAPNVPIRGRPGARLELVVIHHAGNTNLPAVELKQVA